MAKKKPQLKRRSARSIGSKKGKRKKSAKPKLTLKQRLARARKLEALDAGKRVFEVTRKRALEAQPKTRGFPSVVITDSVGRWEKNARNLPADVETVQRLLQTAAQKLQAPQLDPKGIDGKIAQPPRKSNTVAAIEAFQSRSNISIDGLIEPESQTWRALLQALESGDVTSTPFAVISGSVGRWEKNASNLPADVKTVQRLLETAAQKLQDPQLDPKGIDGKIARPPRNSNTVNAIEAFQSRSNISIDGLIEPSGQAWQALLQAGRTGADSSHPFRNDDFPQTYIQQISVSLDDPDHSLTLTWAGPKADSQETGPFRTSPGAGLRGLNCDDDATSRRSGSKCTPKGTHPVQGFQRRLNSDSRATYVTWFVQRRGIALHYFPIVPEYAASHGCVRIESVDVARLIQDNSLVDDTQVMVSGTWTKPRKQWD
jgi:peptidoglycan hydrolase-like protein with peptidoglycan-binding domain